jgi:hypothetical protein
MHKYETSLNWDGQQFHQYQQNEQSPLILTELTEHKKITSYDIRNPEMWQGYAVQWGPKYMIVVPPKYTFKWRATQNIRSLSDSKGRFLLCTHMYNFLSSKCHVLQ